MEIDFEKIYKVTLTAMKLNRSHPEVPRDKKWLLQFAVLHGAFTVVYCVIVYNIVVAINNGNYTDAARNFIPTVCYFVASFQYFILVVKQDTIRKIMDMMKNDFKKTMPHDEKTIVLKYAKKGTSVCHLWLFAAFITIIVFPVKHLMLEIYLLITEEFQLLVVYPLFFPSPIEEVKMQPVNYIVIYVMSCYYLSYAASVYTAFIPLGPFFMLHASGQLEIVKKRASELYNNTGEDVEAKLVEIIKHLQYIYDFVDCIKETFRVVYELLLKGTTILLPVTLYRLVSSFNHGESQSSIEFITFIFSGTVVSFLPCYYSEILMEKGEDVRLAIYSCGWEAMYDHKTRTTILIILQRALLSTSIRTVFRTVCLDALTELFQQSYAIFNLMNAAW